MSMYRCAPLLGVGLVVLLCCGMTALAAKPPQEDVDELEMPTANTDVENAVPHGFLQDIADMMAEKVWGDATACIAEIPLCDLNDDVIFYMFVYQRGRGPVKAFKDIRADVKQGRKEHEAAEKTLAEAEESLDLKPVKNPQLPADVTADPELEYTNPTPEYVKAYWQKNEARKKRYGIGKYGYMLVSARYDLIPIPMIGNGLPEYFHKGDLIKERAQGKAGKAVKLKKIYMVGPAARWYEFQTADGAKTFVDGNAVKEVDPTEVEKASVSVSWKSTDPERKQRVAQAWQSLQRNLQEVQP